MDMHVGETKFPWKSKRQGDSLRDFDEVGT